MSELSKTVGGFRSALQDLIVPEFKALKVELQNINKTLERHEKKLESHDQTLSKLVDELHKLRVDQNERFAAMQKQLDERFAAMQNEFKEQSAATMDSIRLLQKDVSVVVENVKYGERIRQLELQLASMQGKPQKQVAAGV